MDDPLIFDTVFDIAGAAAPDMFMALFGFVLGSVVALFLYLAGTKGWQFSVAFPGIWLAVWVGFLWVPHYQLRASADRCELVEGVVQNYAPEPYAGHADPERFQVGEREFTFSNGILSAGYSRTIGYGGVHIAGRTVRLCVMGNDILKLEVARDVWPQMLSTVSFRLPKLDPEAFSLRLYHVTQTTKVDSHPVVWAKDFALSDFELTAAGRCPDVVAHLEHVVAAAAIGSEKDKVVSAYRLSARCAASPVPPVRSWKAAPRVRLYSSDGDVTVAGLTDGE